MQLSSMRRTEDGMFRTGDRAYRRGDGFVFLGRYDETVRLGGHLVDPAEIEQFLRGRPEIAAARTVGVNATNGVRIVAFVMIRQGFVFREAAMWRPAASRSPPSKYPLASSHWTNFQLAKAPTPRRSGLMSCVRWH